MSNRNTSPRTSLFILIGSVILLTIAIGGCLLNSDSRRSPLDGPVQFSIRESHEENGYVSWSAVSDPVIVLYMRTEVSYGCSNYSIIANTKLSKGTLVVELFGIKKPEICLTSVGPARFQEQIEIPVGEYDLDFVSADQHDLYLLSITEDAIRIQTVDSQFTHPESELEWRYPVNSFAYICGTTTETAWICQDFQDSLLALPNISTFEFPDLGRIPYPESSSGHWHNTPAGYFKYEIEVDYDQVGVLLYRYSRRTFEQQQGISLSTVDYRNERYLSWRLPEDARTH